MTKLEMLFAVGFALLFTAFYTLPLFAKLIGKRWDRTLPLRCLALAISIAFGASLCEGQTNTYPVTNAPTVSQAIDTLLASVQAGQTNWEVIPYGLYAPALKQKYGGGLALLYPLSTYVVTGARVDWVNGGFWMPSGNATLQLPIKLTSWLTITPFTYAGIGVPLGGAQVAGFVLPGKPSPDNNGQPTAILGYGAAIDIYKSTGFIKHASLVGDAEKWTGFDGQQYRLGVALHF